MSRFNPEQVRNLRSWGVEPRPEEIIKPPDPFPFHQAVAAQNEGAAYDRYQRQIAAARGSKGVLENLLDLGWRPPGLR